MIFLEMSGFKILRIICLLETVFLAFPFPLLLLKAEELTFKQIFAGPFSKCFGILSLVDGLWCNS